MLHMARVEQNRYLVLLNATAMTAVKLWMNKTRGALDDTPLHAVKNCHVSMTTNRSSPTLRYILASLLYSFPHTQHSQQKTKTPKLITKHIMFSNFQR